MPTIKEISEHFNVTPQTVRNFVKKEFDIKPERGKPIELTVNQLQITANHFAKTNSKDTQEVFADFAKNEQSILRDFAVLQERVSALERENELLRERLAKADEALEREQMQARGFWSRLGQKLLGGN